MIGIDTPHPGSSRVTAQGLAVGKIVRAGNGYEIFDFRDRRIGWEENSLSAYLQLAVELLSEEPEWEDLVDGGARFMTPSHHCIIKPSKAGWLSTITHHAKYLKTLTPEPDLFAAQARTEQLVNRDHGHRISSSPLLDVASAVTLGFKAIQHAIAPSLLGLDRREITLSGDIEKVASIVSMYRDDNSLPLYPLLHCNVAALVKRSIIAIFKGDRSMSHFVNDMLDEDSQKLQHFRQTFAVEPLSDADYADFVWNKLVKLTEQKVAMLYDG
jgi:hypothetical protein